MAWQSVFDTIRSSLKNSAGINFNVETVSSCIGFAADSPEIATTTISKIREIAIANDFKQAFTVNAIVNIFGSYYENWDIRINSKYRILGCTKTPISS